MLEFKPNSHGKARKFTNFFKQRILFFWVGGGILKIAINFLNLDWMDQFCLRFQSSVCSRIIERLALNGSHKRRVVTISQESFYRDLTSDEEMARAESGDFNFDHPAALEHQLMVQTLRELKRGKAVVIPKYDFRTQRRYIYRGKGIFSNKIKFWNLIRLDQIFSYNQI